MEAVASTGTRLVNNVDNNWWGKDAAEWLAHMPPAPVPAHLSQTENLPDPIRKKPAWAGVGGADI